MCWNKRNIAMKRINKIMRNKQTLKNKIKNKLALCIKKEGYDWFQWGGGSRFSTESGHPRHLSNVVNVGRKKSSWSKNDLKVPDYN